MSSAEIFTQQNGKGFILYLYERVYTTDIASWPFSERFPYDKWS